jgi:hypothetical protein
VEIFHTFPMRRGAAPDAPGGPLYVPRERQGFGRFDAPDRYGAFYFSTLATSAVAEQLQAFRGRSLPASSLRRADGSVLALARIALDTADLVDLDDPRRLVERDLRPSQVATADRARTRPVAVRIHDEGRDGLLWWSALEAAWPNGVLFAERALGRCRLVGRPERLSPDHPSVREAAAFLAIEISAQ